MITATMALLLAGGALIGFLLAVLGAGGSILLLPLLVSGAALPTKAAVPLSLLVVALLALGNVGPYIHRRQIAIQPALVLGVPALAGSWIGGTLVKAGLIPEAVQLGIFTAAALLASWLLNRHGALEHPPNHGRPAGNPVALASQGVLVGLLTGIAGVGGGFAIVPALVLLAGLPMQLASGTSLLLLTTNSLVALAALGHWPTAQLPLLLPLVSGGLLGAVVGQRLAPHLPEVRLRQGFSALLIGSALLSGFEAWRRHDHPPATTAGRSFIQLQRAPRSEWARATRTLPSLRSNCSLLGGAFIWCVPPIEAGQKGNDRRGGRHVVGIAAVDGTQAPLLPSCLEAEHGRQCQQQGQVQQAAEGQRHPQGTEQQRLVEGMAATAVGPFGDQGRSGHRFG